MLFEILFQCILLHQQMSIFVIDQYFLVLQVVYGFIIDIVDGVGVVECIGRRFLPGKSWSMKVPLPLCHQHSTGKEHNGEGQDKDISIMETEFTEDEKRNQDKKEVVDDQPGGEAEDGAHGWWIGMVVGTLAWQQLLQEPHDEALGHPGRQTEGAGKGETVLS